MESRVSLAGPRSDTARAIESRSDRRAPQARPDLAGLRQVRPSSPNLTARTGNAVCLAMAIALIAGGCRIPGYGGPRSHAVLTSRQLCQEGASAMYREDWVNAESF